MAWQGEVLLCKACIVKLVYGCNFYVKDARLLTIENYVFYFYFQTGNLLIIYHGNIPC